MFDMANSVEHGIRSSIVDSHCASWNVVNLGLNPYNSVGLLEQLGVYCVHTAILCAWCLNGDVLSVVERSCDDFCLVNMQ